MASPIAEIVPSTEIFGELRETAVEGELARDPLQGRISPEGPTLEIASEWPIVGRIEVLAP